jgi:hypothetical protein
MLATRRETGQNQMTDKDEIVDTAQFAAELKALAKTVVESKVKTKPQTKQEIIASDDVWNAIKEMKEVHGMTMIDIAEVFKAKGGIWSNSDGKNMGQLMINAGKLRDRLNGGEAETKKPRKTKTASKRSSMASSGSLSEAVEPPVNPASKEEGESKPQTADAKSKPNVASDQIKEAPVNPAYVDRKRL